MQDGRDERFVIHVHLGQDQGDRERMLDVGLAGFAMLAGVGLVAKVVGPADLRHLLG